MYTGIIDHLGIILAIEALPGGGLKLTIQSTFTNWTLGESIAVDGICVTVTDFVKGQFCCELSPETLKLTTATNFVVGDKVNLERSLQIGSRLGGHFVMGHIDGCLIVKKIEKSAKFTRIIFGGLDKHDKVYCAKKGSAAINGISLTINELHPDGFEVMVIPHTLAKTNLQYLQEQDQVNLEYDTLARIVAHQLHLTHSEVVA